jgi:hypothetical protein
VERPEPLCGLGALASPEEPHGEVERVGPELLQRDMGEDVRVVACDHPAQAVVEPDDLEVARGRPLVDRAVLGQEVPGLGLEVRLGLHQDDAGAGLEEHPALAGALDELPPHLDLRLGGHAGLLVRV